MPYENAILRGAIESRARKAQEFETIGEDRFPVRPADADDLDIRENALFIDRTGRTMWGFGNWGNGTW